MEADNVHERHGQYEHGERSRTEFWESHSAATWAKDRNATLMDVMIKNKDSGESSMWSGHCKCLLFLEHRRQRGRDGRGVFICVLSHIKLKGLHIYKEKRQDKNMHM